MERLARFAAALQAMGLKQVASCLGEHDGVPAAAIERSRLNQATFS
jgi:hypothetical protein